MATRLEERLKPFLEEQALPLHAIQDNDDLKKLYPEVRDWMLSKYGFIAGGIAYMAVDWDEFEGLYHKAIDLMDSYCSSGFFAELEVIRRAKALDDPDNDDLAQIVLDVFGSADDYYKHGRLLSEYADALATVIQDYPLDSRTNRLVRWRYGNKVLKNIQDNAKDIMASAEDMQTPYEGD